MTTAGAPLALVLDNEPVDALLSPGHRKHRRVLTLVTEYREECRRHARPIRIVVPTSVRVEAGWSRTIPVGAGLNRLGITDHVLDMPSADEAVRLRSRLPGLSVADAHLGVALQSGPFPMLCLTSDVDDVSAIAGLAGLDVIIVRV